MSIRMKVGEMTNAYRALERIQGVPLPAKGAYWVGRLLNKLRDEFQTAEKVRSDLVVKYGAQMTDAQSYMVPPEKFAEFSAEYEPIAQAEIDVDAQPLRLAVLGESLIPAMDMAALDAAGLIVDEVT